jgi:hypothetical protein
MNVNRAIDGRRQRTIGLSALLLASGCLLSLATPASAAPQCGAGSPLPDLGQDTVDPNDPEAQLKAQALDYLSDAADVASDQFLQDLSEAPGSDVVLGLADMAGAAFGMPGVGEAVGPYISMFSGLFGGGGGGKDAAIQQALTQLSNRTTCLEHRVDALSDRIGVVNQTVAQNENNQRIDLIGGLHGTWATSTTSKNMNRIWQISVHWETRTGRKS